MNVTDIENIICESLKEVIDVPPEELARDTTFDALGLDSISRVGLVTQLEKAIGREIDPEISYEHDTPHSLAVYVATLLGGSSESGAKLPSIQMTYSPPTYTVEQVDVNTSEFKSILQLRAIAYEREAAGERDEVDSYSLHFAARSKDRIIGAVRTTCRKHGPLESEEFYPHWLLGEFGDKLSAVSRLCIQPEFSGSRVPHDLIRCAWKVVLPLGIRIDVSKARLDAIAYYLRMGHFFVRNAVFDFERWDARCAFIACPVNHKYGGDFADLFVGIDDPCDLSLSPHSHLFTREHREIVEFVEASRERLL